MSIKELLFLVFLIWFCGYFGEIRSVPYPTLVIRPQLTIWNSTGFIEISLNDSTKQTLHFIAKGKLDSIGIPEELIITPPSNAFVVDLEPGNPTGRDADTSHVAFVVLRPTFVESLEEWSKKFKIVLLVEPAENREVELIVAKLNEKYSGGCSKLSIVTDKNTIAKDCIMMTNSNNSSPNSILVEPFQYERMLESKDECILTRITPLLVNSVNITSVIQTINRMSWASGAELIAKDRLENIFNLIYNKVPLRDAILKKFEATIHPVKMTGSVTFMRERSFILNESPGIAYDLVIRVTIENKISGSVHKTAQLEVTYIFFGNNTASNSQVIYLSDLLDENIVDFPRKTVNVAEQLIPKQAESIEQNIQADCATPSTLGSFNDKCPTLVINLFRSYMYIYKVDTDSSVENTLVDNFRDGRPTMEEMYKKRLENPNHFFSVRYRQKAMEPNSAVVWKEYFVTLKNGAMMDILELGKHFNLVHATKNLGVGEKHILDAVERKYGKIFCRRYARNDFNDNIELEKTVFTRDGFDENTTVHIGVNLFALSAFKYSFTVDPFDSKVSMSYAGLGNIKLKLIENLYPALMAKNHKQIMTIINELSQMKSICVNNPQCLNLVITYSCLVPNYDSTIQNIFPITTLLHLLPYYNIIPSSQEEAFSTSRSDMISKLSITENIQELEIFSTELINNYTKDSTTVFIVACIEQVKHAYRQQTIWSKLDAHGISEIESLLVKYSDRKVNSYPNNSIEAFNFKTPLDPYYAKYLIGPLQTEAELNKLPVIAFSKTKFKYSLRESIKKAKGLYIRSIKSVARFYKDIVYTEYEMYLSKVSYEKPTNENLSELKMFLCQTTQTPKTYYLVEMASPDEFPDLYKLNPSNYEKTTKFAKFF